MIDDKSEKSRQGSASNLQRLVSCDGYDNFLISIDEKSDHHINADVFEVVSWGIDNIPLEKEIYCKVYMKWDGCCHVWFGDKDNYIHMCGVHSWKKHNQMMEALYRFAEDNIKCFDDSEKWGS